MIDGILDTLRRQTDQTVAMLRAAPDRARSLLSGGLAVGGSAGALGSLLKSTSQAEDAFSHNKSWVFAATRVIAQLIAGQPVRVARKTRNTLPPPGGQRRKARAATLPLWLKSAADDLEPVDDHYLLDVLRNPNPLMVQWHLLYVTAVSLELTGKAHWWLVNEKPSKREPGKPRAVIWPVPCSWIRPVHEADKPFARWELMPGGMGEPVPLDADEVVYFYYPNPADPLDALSPLQAQIRAVMCDEAIQEANAIAFRNGIWPGLAIIAGNVTDAEDNDLGRPLLEHEQRAQIFSMIKRMYGGVVHMGEPFILDALIKDIKRVTPTNQEMDFGSSSEAVKRRIVQGFGVNPIVMGEIQGANMAQSVTAKDHMADMTINPKLEMISQVLTKTVAPRIALPGEELVIYVEPYSPNDRLQTLIEWRFGASMGCARKNEIRTRILGAEPWSEEEGGEELASPPLPPQMGGLADIFGGGGGGGGGGGRLPMPGGESELPRLSDLARESASGPFLSQGPDGHADSNGPVACYLARKAARRDQQMLLWLKAHSQIETPFAAALQGWFAEQLEDVQARLRDASNKGWSARMEKAAGPPIVDYIYDADEWTERLKEVARPFLRRAMTEGAAIVSRRVRRLRGRDTSGGTTKATLADLIIELSPGTAAEIEDALDTILSRPYWSYMAATTKEGIAEGLKQVIEDNGNLYDMTVAIDDVLGPATTNRRSMNIARTESTMALNRGHRIEQDGLFDEGLIEGVEWLAVLDDVTRPEHFALHGTVIGQGEEFNVGGELAPYPGYEGLSAEQRCNCLLPGNLVQGDFLAGTKAFYRGQAVEVVTRGGGWFAVTPHHRVLTPCGFVAAGLLEQGDQIIAYDRQVKRSSASRVGSNDERDEPTPIEDVFESLRLRAAMARGYVVERIPSHHADFHGDELSLQGEIEIVRPDGELIAEHEPATGQEFLHQPLARLDGGLTCEPACCRAERCERHRQGAVGGQSRNRRLLRAPSLETLPLHCRPVRFDTGPLELLGGGAAPDSHAQFSEPQGEGVAGDLVLIGECFERHPGLVIGEGGGCVDSDSPARSAVAKAGPVERAIDRPTDASIRLSKLLDSLPGDVLVDEVLSIRQFPFVGHVYDLQSVSGLIIANGVCLSNCRCTTIENLAGEKAMLAELKAAAWDEAEHPRDDSGKFAESGGGSADEAEVPGGSSTAEEQQADAAVVARCDDILSAAVKAGDDRLKGYPEWDGLSEADKQEAERLFDEGHRNYAENVAKAAIYGRIQSEEARKTRTDAKLWGEAISEWSVANNLEVTDQAALSVDEIGFPVVDWTKIREGGRPANSLPLSHLEDLRSDLAYRWGKLRQAVWQPIADARVDSAETAAEVAAATEVNLDRQWGTMDDKFKVGELVESGRVTEVVVLPQTWKVKADGADYDRTRKAIIVLQEERTKQICGELGVPPPPEGFAEAVWSDWKQSSTSDMGKAIQIAAAEETGGKHRFSREEVNRIKVHIVGQPQYKMLRASIRATAEASQYAMAKAGMDEVTVWRAVMLPRDQVPVGLPVGEYTKLPTIKLLRNGAASTTTDSEVANGWQGVGNLPENPSRVVLRIRVPRSAVVSLPAFGQNYQVEQEFVVSGKKWLAWDAWLDRAPGEVGGIYQVKQEPMEEPLVVDLLALEEGQPHWLSKAESVMPAAKVFREEDHPRVPPGQPGGGQFGAGGGAGDGGASATEEKPQPKVPEGEGGTWSPSQRQAQVRSPAFKQWFGDWEKSPTSASKVVDANGEPQETHQSLAGVSKAVDAEGKPVVVYHGSMHNEFTAFDPAKIGTSNLFGPGFYFTDSPEIAAEYARKTGSDDRVPAAHVKTLRIDKERRAAYFADYRAVIASTEYRQEKYKEATLAGLDAGKAEFLKSGSIPHLIQSQHGGLENSGFDITEKGGVPAFYFEQAASLEHKYGYKTYPASSVKALYLNVRNPKDYDSIADSKDIQAMMKWAAKEPRPDQPDDTCQFYAKHLRDDIPEDVAKKYRLPYDATFTAKSFEKYVAAVREVKPDLFAGVPEGQVSWQAAVYILTDGAESPSRVEAVNRYWRQKGHDGIAHTGGWNIGKAKHKVWIAFAPKQIKSAERNVGAFDPEDSDITKGVLGTSVKVFREEDHPRVPSGSSEGGQFGSGGGAPSADPAFGRPTKPDERHDVKPPSLPFRDPPPPHGKAGGKAGGFSSIGVTNTEVGDLVEEASSKLGLRSILPPGKRQGPLDREWDHSGWAFEMKVCTTASTEYKAKPKASEMEGKRAYAKKNGLKAGIMIVVLDAKKGEAHAYWREGIGAYRLTESNKSEWNYAGTVKVKVPKR